MAAPMDSRVSPVSCGADGSEALFCSQAASAVGEGGAQELLLTRENPVMRKFLPLLRPFTGLCGAGGRLVGVRGTWDRRLSSRPDFRSLFVRRRKQILTLGCPRSPVGSIWLSHILSNPGAPAPPRSRYRDLSLNSRVFR